MEELKTAVQEFCKVLLGDYTAKQMEHIGMWCIRYAGLGWGLGVCLDWLHHIHVTFLHMISGGH